MNITSRVQRSRDRTRSTPHTSNVIPVISLSVAGRLIAAASIYGS
jgi:hypothetical protein